MRRAAAAGSRPASALGRPTANGRPRTGCHLLGEAGDRAAGAAEHDPLDRDRALLGAVEVEREPQLVEQGGGAAPPARRAPAATRPGSPSIASTGCARPTWSSHIRACSGVRPVRRRGRRRCPRGPTGATRVKRQERPLGDGEVGDVADVAVEGRRVAPAPASRLARRRRSPARRGRGSGRRRRGRRRPACRPASRSGFSEASIMSRRAATTTTSIFGGRVLGRRRRRRPPGGRGPPGRAASGSAPGPGSGPRPRAPWGRRSPAAAGPHDDALVGDAEPDPLGELVLGEERAQRLGDGVGVGDLAVVEGAGRQRGDRGRGQLASSR